MPIVDIVTFCEDPSFLNLKLWPMQKTILKTFYRGTEGNEALEFTIDELQEFINIAKSGLDFDFSKVLSNFMGGEKFSTLVLAAGRRSSKTTINSIIALYEAYKMLFREKRNGIFSNTTSCASSITIVCANETQAIDPALSTVKYLLEKSKAFVGCTATEGNNSLSLTLGWNTISIYAHGCASGALCGISSQCVILDDFAYFNRTRSSQESVLTWARASMTAFEDSRLIISSDPLYKNDAFWDILQKSVNPKNSILGLQLPTWYINPDPSFSQSFLEERVKPQDPIAYESCWEARFKEPKSEAVLFSNENKAFFSCSPQEAREAISYIKSRRKS